MNIEELHCVGCGQKGTLSPDSEVVNAWVNWQDEESGDGWRDGPDDVASLSCSACGKEFYLGIY